MSGSPSPTDAFPEPFPELAAELLADPRVRTDYLRHRCDPVTWPPPFVLFGSAVMLLHGLRERIGDRDLFVTEPVADVLALRGWAEHRPHPTDPPFLAWAGDGSTTHAFAAWTDRDDWVDADECRRHAEVVRGWPCIPLWLVAKHKHGALTILADQGVQIEGSRWEKHRRDLDVLNAASVGLVNAADSPFPMPQGDK